MIRKYHSLVKSDKRTNKKRERGKPFIAYLLPCAYTAPLCALTRLGLVISLCAGYVRECDGRRRAPCFWSYAPPGSSCAVSICCWSSRGQSATLCWSLSGSPCVWSSTRVASQLSDASFECVRVAYRRLVCSHVPTRLGAAPPRPSC
jgi:hypothetical protein